MTQRSWILGSLLAGTVALSMWSGMASAMPVHSIPMRQTGVSGYIRESYHYNYDNTDDQGLGQKGSASCSTTITFHGKAGEDQANATAKGSYTFRSDRLFRVNNDMMDAVTVSKGTLPDHNAVGQETIAAYLNPTITHLPLVNLTTYSFSYQLPTLQAAVNSYDADVTNPANVQDAQQSVQQMSCRSIDEYVTFPSVAGTVVNGHATHFKHTSTAPSIWLEVSPDG